MPKPANAKPCQNCGHQDLHGEVSGCIALVSPQGARAAWCDCTEYVAPPTAAAAKAVGRTIPSRTTDPTTSHAAAASVRITANNQRGRLLAAWGGLEDATDEEAMEAAEGVSPVSEYAKRSSELRDAGFIEPTGTTRKGATGIPRIVSAITDAGRAALAAL